MDWNAPFMHWFYERIAKGKSYEEMIQRLQRNETTIAARMTKAKETSYNRKQTIHVIGIERWSCHRLHVLLGEPLVMDEYDGYAPSAESTMTELVPQFKQTRAATITLAHELQDKEVPITAKVIHNGVGELTVGAWLFYIENHTGRDTALMALGL
jgi:hypothetical protein